MPRTASARAWTRKPDAIRSIFIRCLSKMKIVSWSSENATRTCVVSPETRACSCSAGKLQTRAASRINKRPHEKLLNKYGKCCRSPHASSACSGIAGKVKACRKVTRENSRIGRVYRGMERTGITGTNMHAQTAVRDTVAVKGEPIPSFSPTRQSLSVRRLHNHIRFLLLLPAEIYTNLVHVLPQKYVVFRKANLSKPL